MLLSSASNVAMDEKPAMILYSPARSIGLFKRYPVVSVFCIKSRDGRKACKDASFAGPIYRPVQTLSGFSRLLATYSMLMFLGMFGYDIFQDSGRSKIPVDLLRVNSRFRRGKGMVVGRLSVRFGCLGQLNLPGSLRSRSPC